MWLWCFLPKPTRESTSMWWLIIAVAICTISEHISPPLSINPQNADAGNNTAGGKTTRRKPFSLTYILWEILQSKLWKNQKTSPTVEHTDQLWNLFKVLYEYFLQSFSVVLFSMIVALFISEQIETQLAEYHKLARKLKLIPISAENSKGHDFEIHFNPEAGPNCLVKYRTQIKLSRTNAERLLALTIKF